MKTTIVSLLAATLIGFACYLTNEMPDAAGLLAIAFATGLVAWTVSEYDRRDELPEHVAGTVPFPSEAGRARAAVPGMRLAA